MPKYGPTPLDKYGRPEPQDSSNKLRTAKIDEHVAQQIKELQRKPAHLYKLMARDSAEYMTLMSNHELKKGPVKSALIRRRKRFIANLQNGSGSRQSKFASKTPIATSPLDPPRYVKQSRDIAIDSPSVGYAPRALHTLVAPRRVIRLSQYDGPRARAAASGIVKRFVEMYLREHADGDVDRAMVLEEAAQLGTDASDATFDASELQIELHHSTCSGALVGATLTAGARKFDVPLDAAPAGARAPERCVIDTGKGGKQVFWVQI
jgi:hypothetical protein